jgi:hypothetical protein
LPKSLLFYQIVFLPPPPPDNPFTLMHQMCFFDCSLVMLFGIPLVL